MASLKRVKEVYYNEGAVSLGKKSLMFCKRAVRPYWLHALSLVTGRSPTEVRYNQLSKDELEKYGHTDEDLESSRLLHDLMIEYSDSAPNRVLEIGCNAGRRLHYLHTQGVENPHGIEINNTALKLMDEAFPELADAVTVYNGPAQAEIADIHSQKFDVVYSTAVIQHIMSDTDSLFDNMARVSSDLIITFENESLEPIPESNHNEFLTNNGVKYVKLRDYKDIFTKRGYKEVDSFTAWGDDPRSGQLSEMETSGFNNCYTARVFKRAENI